MTETANPSRGWRVEAEPSATVSRTEAGRFKLPVVVYLDHRFVARLDLVLTGEQIELIYASMRGLVAAGFPARESVPRRDGLDL